MKMMTSNSFEAIIAAMNSIHLRTQLRVMSAVAPEKARGVSTAAMMIIIFRIIIAAQTTTTAARMTRENSRTIAGFATPSMFTIASWAPKPAMFVCMV